MKIKNKVHLIAMVGAMSAMAVVLAILIHFPIFPSVPFLEYDPADIVIYMSTFVFGIPNALLVTVVVSIVQGVTVSAGSGVFGILMHIVSSGTYVLVSGLVYKIITKKSGQILSLTVSTAAGVIATTVIMIGWNLLITPLYMGGTVEEVLSILLFIVFFNVIKAGINGILAALLTYPVRRIVKKL